MEPTLYLFFNGTCLEAMTQYAEILGGEIRPEDIFRNADAPDAESRMPGGDDMVMNMSMRLGSATIMASDSPENWYSAPAGFRVRIEAPTLADFERIFAALAQDARRTDMAPGETFWAERFTMFTDRFGTPWMLSFTGTKSA